MTKIEITPALTLFTTPVLPGSHSHRQAEREAVRRIIADVYGPEVEILHTPDGAPYLSGSRHLISVSHCHTTAGVLISTDGTRPGLDLETADRTVQLTHVAPRFLTSTELPYWSSSPRRLLQAWTLKEAAFKAAGIPLADLRLIALDPDNKKTTLRGITLPVISSEYLSEHVFMSVVVRYSLEP